MARTPEQNNAIITGNIPRQLLLFFFPIWLGTMFQQLYNTVGYPDRRQRGTQALAAGGQPALCAAAGGAFCGPAAARE